MADILMIAGSPSRSARSTATLEYARALLTVQGWTTEILVVRDLPAEDLLHARLDSPILHAAHQLLEAAQAVVIATPIYKAAYSGVLKVFLDLLPQNALANKIVLPLATGGSPAHMLALDYALKPVLGALGATHILRGVYLVDTQMQIETDGTLRLELALEQRLKEALTDLHLQLQAVKSRI